MRILMVCTGNICRSPAAEVVLRDKAKAIGLVMQVDSAGVAAYHAGDPADLRAQREGLTRGYDLRSLRARMIEPKDFKTFDWIFYMTREHARVLEDMARNTPNSSAHLEALGSWSPGFPDEVRDPYYGGDEGFAEMYDHLESALDMFLESVRK